MLAIEAAEIGSRSTMEAIQDVIKKRKRKLIGNRQDREALVDRRDGSILRTVATTTIDKAIVIEKTRDAIKEITVTNETTETIGTKETIEMEGITKTKEITEIIKIIEKIEIIEINEITRIKEIKEISEKEKIEITKKVVKEETIKMTRIEIKNKFNKGPIDSRTETIQEAETNKISM